jgi:hypothetical protein
MEREPCSEADGFREIHSLLVDLHVAALQLPDLDGEDDAPDVRVDQSAIRRSRLSGPLGTFYYDIFEPLAEPPGTYVGNSIAGDLGDIYGDLKRGPRSLGARLLARSLLAMALPLLHALGRTCP